MRKILRSAAALLAVSAMAVSMLAGAAVTMASETEAAVKTDIAG